MTNLRAVLLVSTLAIAVFPEVARARQDAPPSDPHSRICHDAFQSRDYQRAAEACATSAAAYARSREEQRPGSKWSDLYGMYEAADDWLLSDVYLHGGEDAFGGAFRAKAYAVGVEAYTIATLIVKPYPESYAALEDWQRAVALYTLRIRGDLLAQFPTMWCEVPRLASDETFVDRTGVRHNSSDCVS